MGGLGKTEKKDVGKKCDSGVELPDSAQKGRRAGGRRTF